MMVVYMELLGESRFGLLRVSRGSWLCKCIGGLQTIPVLSGVVAETHAQHYTLDRANTTSKATLPERIMEWE